MPKFTGLILIDVYIEELTSQEAVDALGESVVELDADCDNRDNN